MSERSIEELRVALALIAEGSHAHPEREYARVRLAVALGELAVARERIRAGLALAEAWDKAADGWQRVAVNDCSDPHLARIEQAKVTTMRGDAKVLRNALAGEALAARERRTA